MALTTYKLVNKKLIVHTQPQGDRYSQIVEYQTGTVTPQVADVSINLDKLLLF